MSKTICALLNSLLLLVASQALAADDPRSYQTADEAWRVGAAFYNARNYAASQEPLEAALKLATDDAFRLKVYEALLASYRLLPEEEKYIEASEFIWEKSTSAPKQSLTRGALMSFVYQRGKTDELAKRYETLLEREPDNRLALSMLGELYGRVKRDPQRAIQVLEHLARLDEKAGTPLDISRTAELARQHVQAKQHAQGAELYEKIAPLDPKLAAWHWKEAASAWLAGGEKDKALAAAKKAAAGEPEARSEQLAHFWHRNLADVFKAAGEPQLAIPHYQQAIAKTTIAGYLADCRKSLAEAQKQAGQ